MSANMTLAIFEASQLHSTVYVVIKGAAVLWLQHWELGCLPQLLY